MLAICKQGVGKAARPARPHDARTQATHIAICVRTAKSTIPQRKSTWTARCYFINELYQEGLPYPDAVCTQRRRDIHVA